MEGSLPGGSAPASVDASKEDHILDVILFAEAFLRRALTYSSAKSMVALKVLSVMRNCGPAMMRAKTSIDEFFVFGRRHGLPST
ncbi:hypothetical protein WT19_06950 [Burkholderia stagnalis]|nr:hypothetical protein WT17_28380 [Burkholderia stagnalis]KVO78064.1 hypothetical protein WT19_06950 [Burkholderia stagnalis]KVX65600.1 hypothetical protein WT34_04260 [Burkholderia stagnalis]KWH89067.1 hypothetical protein WT68_19645 [Burkholderia stagnalis]KWH92176.1 hypothetical protein WT69_17955 [Burkholderia stagnalis]